MLEEYVCRLTHTLTHIKAVSYYLLDQLPPYPPREISNS